MKQRLQKILSGCGVASRRASEQMIAQGRVTCNGRICALGDSADPDTDEILLDGRPLAGNTRPVYLMLYKPRGYVTTLSDEKGRPDVSRLVSDCGTRVYPVGRLDMDSEGLLLFTNDGEFANHLMHPSHAVDKLYEVWVRGFTEPGYAALARPVVLDGYRIRPPRLDMLRRQGDRAVLRITIHEGRNRQIRRMCQMAGMQVQRLKRLREGTLDLGSLEPGKWRYLTEEEVKALNR